MISIDDGSAGHNKIEVIPPKPSDDEESWDHYNVPTYNPKKYVESKPILRKNIGMSRYEREIFRETEFHRISKLWNDETKGKKRKNEVSDDEKDEKQSKILKKN